jgi:hypothetical protein
MLTRFHQFDKALAKRGWTYDAGGMKFSATESACSMPLS